MAAQPTLRPAMNLDPINDMPREAFVEALGGIVEHSPWVAAQAFELRPFASVAALHAAMLSCVEQAPRSARLELARAHPELAGREADAGTLTASSSFEQQRLGLTSLSRAQHDRLGRLNAAYRQKFGFPFITAVRLHADLASIFASLEERLARDAQTELAETVRQIGEVMRGRLDALFGATAS